MTDNEIVKAWEKCANPKNDCYGDDPFCPYCKYDKGTGECFKQLREDVTNLIKRKDEMLSAQASKIFLYEDVLKEKTAEIERLKSENKELDKENDAFVNLLDEKCNECVAFNNKQAIKEFAERLKNIYAAHDGLQIVVDNLVKEMTEQKNDFKEI